MPTVGSLFSGVGGLDLGLERAGWDVRWQVEIDDYRRQTLARHWPDVQRHGDITAVDAADLERVDLVCGGFPCQDLSVAGKRSGLAGERSGLFWEIVRILGASHVRPRWLLLENVPGLLSSCSCRGCHKLGVFLRWHRRRSNHDCSGCRSAKARRKAHRGTDFAVVCAALVGLGYELQYRIFDSQYFGLAQRRRRVFIVGHLGSPCGPEILFEPQSGRRDTPPSRQAGQDIAPGLKRRADGSDRGGDAAYAVASPLHRHHPRANADQTHIAYALNGKYRNEADLDTFAIKRAFGGSNGHGIYGDGTVHTLDGTGGDAIAQPLRSEGGSWSAQEWNAVAFRKRTKAHSTEASDESWEESERGNPLTVDQRPTTLVGTPPDADRVRAVTGLSGQLDHTTSDSRRYASLGDAVSVPVAHWVGKRILRAHMEAAKRYAWAKTDVYAH